MTYFAIKHLHITLAMLSGIFFFVRGLLMMSDSPLLHRRWATVLPHIIDTALLASAVALVIISAQYPFEQTWLTAKLLALIAYIAVGTVAIKRGRTKSIRIAAFLAALAIFGYIVMVALTKQPI